MMHSTGNMSGNNRASERIRRLCMFLLLSLAPCGFPGRMQAEEQSGPFLLASTNQTLKDIEIEYKIRQALRQDAQLRPLNLGVHQSGGVANLSGPVPSAQLKQRAIAIVQRITGVLAVNSKDLYISTSEPAGKRLSVVIQEDRPTQTRSASPGSPSSGLGPFASSLPSGSGRQITLLAPEMAAPPAPKRPSPKLRESRVGEARLTANPHPEAPAVSITIALEQLRRRDTRYQQIHTHVQGKTVYIYPNGTATEDAMTFAQAVRRLPGVQHVILSSDSR